MVKEVSEEEEKRLKHLKEREEAVEEIRSLVHRAHKIADENEINFIGVGENISEDKLDTYVARNASDHFIFNYIMYCVEQNPEILLHIVTARRV